MPAWKPVPEVMNGFKVIKDLGRSRENSRNRYLIVVCKVCNKEFETCITSINRIKSCGCVPAREAKNLESEINGFKILKDLGYENGSRRAIVICKGCQKEYEVDPNKLRYRNNCGCVKKGVIATRYNKICPRLIQTYKHMVSRCYCESNKDFYNYGARGITVCDDWKNDRNIFIEWAFKNGYQDDLTIDRIDGTKGYYPDNCRWADAKTQARNVSRKVMTMELAKQMTIDSKIMTVRQLACKYHVSEGTAWNVIHNKSWT